MEETKYLKLNKPGQRDNVFISKINENMDTIDSELEKNKEELGEKAPVLHKHNWSDIESKPSIFPPSSHIHAWSEISDKPSVFPPGMHSHSEYAKATDLELVKLSGVESNKILVDALNSKKVSASTNDSIKINVNKVKGIKIGDYSIGEMVKLDSLEKVVGAVPDGSRFDEFEWRFGGHHKFVTSVAIDSEGYIISGSADDTIKRIHPEGILHWSFEHTSDINEVVVGKDNSIYGATADKKAIKLTHLGKKIWEYTGHKSEVLAIAVDKDNNVYSSDRDSKVFKISPDGNKIWELNVGNFWIYSLTTDTNGNIYVGTRGRITKVNTNGNKVWELNEGEGNIAKMVISKDNYIYAVSERDKIFKFSLDGKKIWEYKVSASTIAVDDDNNIYINPSRYMTKVSPDGKVLWEFGFYPGSNGAITLDKTGCVYIGRGDNTIMKVNPQEITLGYKLL